MIPALARGEPAVALPYGSLAEAIGASVAAQPEGDFLHFRRDGSLVTAGFGETLERARRLAAGYQRRGLRAGQGVVLNVARSEDFIPALWGAILAGLVIVPLVQHAGRRLGAERRREVFGFACDALGDGHVVTDDPEVADLLSGTLQSGRVLDLADLAGGDVNFRPVPGDLDALRIAILTSGSTGRSKLVGLSDRAVMGRWWPKVPDGRDRVAFLSWSPFDHVMGLALSAPNRARKIHLDAERFAAHPLSWLDAIEHSGTTHATMTNFSMSVILDALRSAPGRNWRLDSIRKIGIGTEQVSPTLCAEFLDRLAPFGVPRDALILGYGLTECGPVVGGGVPFVPGAATVGGGAVVLDRPTAGHAVRIVGEDGGLLAEGEVGRIEVQGPTMTSGYLGEASGEALITADGWLRTGDLGVLRDGLLTVVGRIKELVIINGRKIACHDIETAIMARNGGQTVLVAALADDPSIRDPRLGKPVGVFVVDDAATMDLAMTARAVRRIVASVYRFAPAVVGLIRSAEVPRTALGKIQRHAFDGLLGSLAADGRLHRMSADAGDGESGALPRDEVEREIAGIWGALLRHDGGIGRNADFYALGGDSVLALQMCFALEDRFGCAVPMEEFAEGATLAEFAAFIVAQGAGRVVPDDPQGAPALPADLADRMREALATWPGEETAPGAFLRRVGAAQAGVPVFWCMQNGTEARNFGATVGAGRPAFAMRSGAGLIDYGAPAKAALAARYADEIVSVFPAGPIVIGGTCQGAIIALAVARQLLAEGRQVQLFAVADANLLPLFGGEHFDAPVAIFPARGSRFNPHRRFSDPAAGLAKLFPAGLMMRTLAVDYPHIMGAQAVGQLHAVLEEAVAWSADRRSGAGPEERSWYPDSISRGTIRSAARHRGLMAGQRVELEVRVTNSSTLDWEPYAASGIALGNHWLSAGGEVLVWSDGRAPLRETIPSGTARPLTLTVTAPARPGSYLLEVDMVEEGVRWFAEKRMRPLYLPVTVESRFTHLLRLPRRAARALVRRLSPR